MAIVKGSRVLFFNRQAYRFDRAEVECETRLNYRMTNGVLVPKEYVILYDVDVEKELDKAQWAWQRASWAVEEQKKALPALWDKVKAYPNVRDRVI